MFCLYIVYIYKVFEIIWNENINIYGSLWVVIVLFFKKNLIGYRNIFNVKNYLCLEFLLVCKYL